MRFPREKFIKAVCLLLVLILSLSFLGAAIPNPPGNTEAAPASDPAVSTAQDSDEGSPDEDAPENSPAADSDTSAEDAPRIAATAQENPEASESTVEAQSWTWIWADPDYEGSLAQEQDSGRYILDIPKNPCPYSEIAASLPSSVSFTLSDGSSMEMAVSDWTRDYPDEGIESSETDVEFIFTPVYAEAEKTIPQFAEGLMPVEFTLRVMGSSDASHLPETKAASNKTVSVRYLTYVDEYLFQLHGDNVYIDQTFYQRSWHNETLMWFGSGYNENPYTRFGVDRYHVFTQEDTTHYASTGPAGQKLYTTSLVSDTGLSGQFSYLKTVNESPLDVYYLKNNTKTLNGVDRMSLAKEQTFYSVKKDIPGQAGESYIFNGESGEVKVFGEAKDLQVYKVNISHTATGITKTEEPVEIPSTYSNGYTTFSFNNIQNPYIIRAKDGVGTLPTGTKRINFYVLADGKKTLVNSQDIEYYSFPNDDVHYIDPYSLELNYGLDYGFKQSEFTESSMCIGSSASDVQDKFWVQKNKSFDNKVYCGIANTAGANIYYLPNSSIADRNEHSLSSVASSETFYSLRIIDPEQRVFDNINREEPEVLYIPASSSRNVTLPTTGLSPDDAIIWQGSGCTFTETADGENVILSVSPSSASVISPALKSLAAGEKRIHYYTNLNPSYKPNNPEYETPKIKGKDEYICYITENHTVLEALPSYYYSYTVENEKYLGKVSFDYWFDAADSSRHFMPGTVLGVSDISGDELNLKAAWKVERASASNKGGSMANFFICLEAVPEGSSTWGGSGNAVDYTDSIYTTDVGVKASDYRAKAGNGQQYLLGADATTNGPTLQECNAEVMQLQNGIEINGFNFKAEFPSDEQALSYIRQNSGSKKITMNGQTIPPNILNSDNFTVKWSKFALGPSGAGDDGWHIDGVLAVKESKLVVKKGFSGERQAIEQIKADPNFCIKLDALSASAVNKNMVLTLDGHEINGTATLGPVDYDQATDEYTWLVTVDPLFQYRIHEESYEYQNPAGQNDIVSDSWYMVRNSTVKGENTSENWMDYNPAEGIVITARGSNPMDKNYLTVELDNNYTLADTLILSKLDGISKNPMDGIDFQITYIDENNTRTEMGTYSTNANGYIYIPQAKPGTYEFIEKVPKGYADPGKITLKLENAGQTDKYRFKITSLSSANTNPNQNLPYTDFTENSLEFTVFNYSKYFVPVTVHADWGPDTDKKTILLQLCLDGQPINGQEYYVRLKGTGDMWQHTWTDMPVFVNLPVYVDKQLANYSVREISIGDTVYSPDYSSGYRYYDVQQSPMLYIITTADGSIVKTPDLPEDEKSIQEIELNIKNTRRMGNASIRKIDSDGLPVAGAGFTLYRVPDTHYNTSGQISPGLVQLNASDTGNSLSTGSGEIYEFCTVLSDAKGFVQFERLPVDTYYMCESSIPGGYKNAQSYDYSEGGKNYHYSSYYILDFDSVRVSLQEVYTISDKQAGTSTTAVKVLGNNSIVNQAMNVYIQVHNEVSGAQAILNERFDFAIDSDRDVMVTGSHQNADPFYRFSLTGGDAGSPNPGISSTSEIIAVQSGSVVDLNQLSGHEYSTSWTVNFYDPQGNPIGSAKTGFGKDIMHGNIPNMPDGSRIVVQVKNVNDSSPDTGIELDSLPYIGILAASTLTAALFFIIRQHRRRNNEDS